MKILTKGLNKKKEYGDFQTPQTLANSICQKLVDLGVNPETIIEPTCGTGTFIESAIYSFPQVKQVVGLEINDEYLFNLKERLKDVPESAEVKLIQEDFFKFDWEKLLTQTKDNILILGNLPWVTNSQQGTINANNLPQKTNFQHHRGLEAITGKSNFDISEWMLIRLAELLSWRRGHLAIICKTSVARKLLYHLYINKIALSHSAIFQLDARKHFNVSVSACLLFCHFNGNSYNYDYKVFTSLKGEENYSIGYRNGIVVKDLVAFEETKSLYKASSSKWRSGVKHDRSEVMEFRKLDGCLINGLGEKVCLEDEYIYPLLKGSDIANSKTTSTNKYVLITQKYIGEPTEKIKENAPKTWEYLQKYSKYLDNRKSKIYRNSPCFSIFGVGDYTFSQWKIAISGLYKSLRFQLVGKIENKPVIFDDTVYFLGFENETFAKKVFNFLNSPTATKFLDSLIFWDDKRPIKSSILNKITLEKIDNINLHL